MIAPSTEAWKDVTIVTRALTVASLLSVMSAAWPVLNFCRSVWSTALRSTACWVAISAIAWFVGSALAVLEPAPGDWGWVGLVRVAVCATLVAPVVAVLGARRPGELIWNFIVISLLVVFSLPILEQALLGKELATGRVGLDGPRTVLFGVIAAVGVANYLPTRFAIVAVMFSAACLCELSVVGPWPLAADQVVARHAIVGLFLSLAAWSGWAIRSRANDSSVGGQWQRMRNGWGFIWSSRVRDRWNASSRQHHWNAQLDWDGFRREATGESVDMEVDVEGVNYFRRLLRRFFDSEK